MDLDPLLLCSGLCPLSSHRKRCGDFCLVYYGWTLSKVEPCSKVDSITVTGDDGRSYVYRVTSVRKANADDAIIDLSPSIGAKLTLVTCDTLTGKSSRFIMEADLVGEV